MWKRLASWSHHWMGSLAQPNQVLHTGGQPDDSDCNHDSVGRQIVVQLGRGENRQKASELAERITRALDSQGQEHAFAAASTVTITLPGPPGQTVLELQQSLAASLPPVPELALLHSMLTDTDVSTETKRTFLARPGVTPRQLIWPSPSSSGTKWRQDLSLHRSTRWMGFRLRKQSSFSEFSVPWAIRCRSLAPLCRQQHNRLPVRAGSS